VDILHAQVDNFLKSEGKHCEFNVAHTCYPQHSQTVGVFTKQGKYGRI